MTAPSVATKVAEAIVQIAPLVEEKVIETLANRELDRRAEAVVKVIDLLDKLDKEMLKIRPDQVFYDETGKVVSQSWSKAKLEERNKLQAKIDKHVNSINKALGEKGDYNDVYNLAKGKDGGGDESKGKDNPSSD